MNDTPQPEFQEVVKRLLSTPPKPHTATKGSKGKGDDAKSDRGKASGPRKDRSEKKNR